MPRLVLLGVGAMNSPCYRPAGLLAIWPSHRVMLDVGGPADPGEPLDAWLVSDEHAELMAQIRRRAVELEVTPPISPFQADDVRPLPLRHTSHTTVGYPIETARQKTVWAPEFWEFPEWAAGADLMFADAAGWDRPIRFAGGVGGHASVRDVATAARHAGVRRLVFAHIGRPSIRQSTGVSAHHSGNGAAKGQRFGCVDATPVKRGGLGALSPFVRGPVGPVWLARRPTNIG